MQHRLPAPFALVAERMQPLHRALVVDGMPPVDVNVDELMGDLAKEFQNSENLEPWIAGGKQGACDLLRAADALSQIVRYSTRNCRSRSFTSARLR